MAAMVGWARQHHAQAWQRPETVFVALNRSWAALDKTAERRRAAAGLLLAHWLSCLPNGARGIDLLAETTLGKLAASVAGDALLATGNGHIDKLVDRARCSGCTNKTSCA